MHPRCHCRRVAVLNERGRICGKRRWERFGASLCSAPGVARMGAMGYRLRRRKGRTRVILHVEDAESERANVNERAQRIV